MWSVQQTWKLGRRAAGFFGGLLVALLLAAGPAAGQTPTWSAPMTLSNGGLAANPAVAITSSGQIFVAWSEDGDIYFKRSSPSGGSCSGAGELKFDAPLPLSNRTKDAFGRYMVTAGSPSIAVNGGEVFVAWQEVRVAGIPGGVQAIRFRRSTNGGAGFNDPEDLRSNQVNPTNPSVAADGSGVFVAWQEVVPGIPFVVGPTTSLLVAQSLNGNVFSSAPVHSVTSPLGSPAESFQPSVASDGTTVYVGWRETAASSRGVWNKGYAKANGPATAGSAIQLRAASASNPKLAVQGTQEPPQVTAAWFEGGNIKACTLTNCSVNSVKEQIYPPSPLPSTITLSNLSVNFGGAGRLVAWRETNMTASTRAFRYFLQGAADTVPGATTGMSLGSPSLGQDGTARLVATWHENGANGTAEVKEAHAGDFGSAAPGVSVWHAPDTLQAKTMYQGNGVFNFWIQGLPADVALDSLNLIVNKQFVQPIRTTLGDANGDGTPDLQLTFRRSDLQKVFDGTIQPDGSYTVTGTYTITGSGNTVTSTGNTNKSGCFSGAGAVPVRIIR